MRHIKAPVVAVMLLGCLADGPGAGEGEPPELPKAVPGGGQGLPLLQGDFERTGLGNGSMRARFVFDGSEVDLTSHARADGLLDVQLEFNGMVLTGLIDERRRISELDGFAAAQGRDTVLTEDDRRVLEALVPQLEKASTSHSDDMVMRLVGLWAQAPESFALQRTVAADRQRAVVDYCSKYDQWIEAWHEHGDDSGSPGCPDWYNPSAECISNALVGSRAQTLGVPEDTYYWINNGWTTVVPNHLAYNYQLGECYGNCGLGCPSGNQRLSQDCMNHDQCVRNGHSIIASACNSELGWAADDEVFATACPNTAAP